MQPHNQHITSLVIVILIVGAIYGLRLRRVSKKSTTKEIGLGTIIALSILIIFGNTVRIITHQQLAIPLTFTWLLAFIICLRLCYRIAIKHPIKKNYITDRYMVPSHLYKRFLYLMIPYALTMTILVQLYPSIINNLSYLYITTFLGGMISGTYLGYCIGMIKGYKTKK